MNPVKKTADQWLELACRYENEGKITSAAMALNQALKAEREAREAAQPKAA